MMLRELLGEVIAVIPGIPMMHALVLWNRM